MIGTTRQKSKLDLPSKILAPQGNSFSLNAQAGLVNLWRQAGCLRHVGDGDTSFLPDLNVETRFIHRLFDAAEGDFFPNPFVGVIQGDLGEKLDAADGERPS